MGGTVEKEPKGSQSQEYPDAFHQGVLIQRKAGWHGLAADVSLGGAQAYAPDLPKASQANGNGKSQSSDGKTRM